MNNQKVKVQYKEQQCSFDFDLIENLEQLRLAIKLRFDDLPLGYDIRLENQHGNFLTSQEVTLLKQFKAQDIDLYIEDHKDDQLDIESISSDLQDIEILPIQRERRSRINEIAFRKSRESLKKQSNIKEVKFQTTNPQVIEKPIKEKQVEILNDDVQCNGCFEFPIKGYIYKCLVCRDYDLCSKCEVTLHHFHPVLKITKKYQYPVHLKVSFSRKSKKQMQKMVQLDKINEQRRKRLKYQKEVSDYQVIDPSKLKSQKVCAKNFVSEIVGSI